MEELVSWYQNGCGEQAVLAQSLVGQSAITEGGHEMTNTDNTVPDRLLHPRIRFLVGDQSMRLGEEEEPNRGPSGPSGPELM
jgi:hypothetical protein